MRRILLASVVCVAAAFAAEPKAGPWKPLFNGRDLSGWYTFLDGVGRNQDPAKVFQVRDGVLHIYKDTEAGSTVPFGYIATDREYENYDLRLEFRWGGKKFAPRQNDPRDSGLLYHITGADALWPVSIECQIMEGETGDIYAIKTRVTSPIDPAQRKDPKFLDSKDGGVPFANGSHNDVAHVISTRIPEVDGWNRVEIHVRAGGAVHLVNGKVTNQWTSLMQEDPAHPGQFLPITKGRILLQAEGAEILYRKIEIREVR